MNAHRPAVVVTMCGRLPVGVQKRLFGPTEIVVGALAGSDLGSAAWEGRGETLVPNRCQVSTSLWAVAALRTFVRRPLTFGDLLRTQGGNGGSCGEK